MALTTERLAFGHRTSGGVRAIDGRSGRAAVDPPPVRLLQVETWDWGWGGLLVFSVLLFFRPQDQFAVLGQAHVSDAAALIGLTAMIVVNQRRRRMPVHVTPEVVGLALLGVVILAGIPFSIWPGGSLAVFTTLFLQVSLIFLLMVNTVTSFRRVDRLCAVIVLAFGYVALRVCVDYLRGVNLVEGNRATGPLGGFFENPNDLALNLAAFLPLSLMYVRRPAPWFIRLGAAAIALLMVAALVFTKSRSGMVGLVVMLAVYVAATRLVTPGLIVGGILASLLLIPLLPASFTARMSSITNPEMDATGSRAERVELLERAWQVFLEHPLTGVGAGQFRNFGRPNEANHWREAHNVLLQVASETGVAGLALFVFLVARAFRATGQVRTWLRPAVRRRRAPPGGTVASAEAFAPEERARVAACAATLLACLSGWFAAALFASVAFNWTFYYLLGLAVATREIVRTRRAAPLSAAA